MEGAGQPLSPGAIGERPDDRRRLLVEITDDARALLDRFLPEVHAWQREVMSVLSPSEQAALLRILAKVQRRLGDVPPPGPAPPRRRSGRRRPTA